jgi:hypothetical protein
VRGGRGAGLHQWLAALCNARARAHVRARVEQEAAAAVPVMACKRRGGGRQFLSPSPHMVGLNPSIPLVPV